jgi:hypothetical protein
LHAHGLSPSLTAELAAGQLTFDCEPPDRFLCPITAEVMVDPVVAMDGHTYSREGISEWLKHKNTSPNTNEALPGTALVPNHHLRGEVLEWVQRHRVAAGSAAAASPAPAPAAPAPATPAAAARAVPVPPPSLADEDDEPVAILPVTLPVPAPAVGAAPALFGATAVAAAPAGSAAAYADDPSPAQHMAARIAAVVAPPTMQPAAASPAPAAPVARGLSLMAPSLFGARHAAAPAAAPLPAPAPAFNVSELPMPPSHLAGASPVEADAADPVARPARTAVLA